MIRVGLVACSALALLSGCLSIPDDVFACVDDSGCPDDFECVGSSGARRCVRAGDTTQGDWACSDGSGVARLCDGRPDCDDGSDEAKCGSRECASGGDTLRTAQFCDGVVDCEDGSDESNCALAPCLDTASEATDTKIPRAWLCDGDRDCPFFFSSEDPTRVVDEDQCLLCDDGEERVHSFFYCDGAPNCSDESDEAECFYCEDPSGPVGSDPVPRWALCDGVQNCANGNDELLHCNGEFDCVGGGASGPSSIPRYFTCDGHAGLPDCEDGLDEEACALTPAEGQVLPDTWPATLSCPGPGELPAWALCQGVTHCPDYSDEHRPNCPFICLDGTRIPRDWVCDQNDDCPQGEDERAESGPDPCAAPL